MYPAVSSLPVFLADWKRRCCPSLCRQPGRAAYIHVCVDDQTLALLAEQLAFFAPELRILRFPAWDCLPYDRVSPSPDIVAQRLATLAEVGTALKAPDLVLTTVNAMLMRTVVPRLCAGLVLVCGTGPARDRQCN